MFSIFTYVMSCVTHSEPGLPMVFQTNEKQPYSFPVLFLRQTADKGDWAHIHAEHSGSRREQKMLSKAREAREILNIVLFSNGFANG